LRSASALARIQPRDLESPATVLARDESPAGRLARLVAATLVRHHQGSAAEKLLLRLAVDPEPATAALALGRLEQLDPNLVAPLNDRVVRSPDPKVRRLSTTILHGQATPDAVRLLGHLLDDVHPEVRRSAADALVGLAPQPPLAQSVRAAAMRALTEAGPRGLEQAALVVGTLDHEPAADRLLQLLDHPQPAVNIAAAWALRRLAVPATAAPILERIRRETEKTQELGRKLSKLTPDEIAATQLPYFAPLYEQLGHLIEALGAMRYEPCLTLLGEYQFLPKPRVRGLNEPPSIEVNEQPTVRTAAYWALGHFHAGKPDPKIVKLCLERLRDVTLDNPEILTVRQMAAVALARMRAESALEYIKRFAIGAGAYTDLAATCRWAQEQITGQPAAPLEPEVINQINWQIEPLDY
jgi:HEAT repeat protein